MPTCAMRIAPATATGHDAEPQPEPEHDQAGRPVVDQVVGQGARLRGVQVPDHRDVRDEQQRDQQEPRRPEPEIQRDTGREGRDRLGAQPAPDRADGVDGRRRQEGGAPNSNVTKKRTRKRPTTSASAPMSRGCADCIAQSPELRRTRFPAGPPQIIAQRQRRGSRCAVRTARRRPAPSSGGDVADDDDRHERDQHDEQHRGTEEVASARFHVEASFRVRGSGTRHRTGW